MPLDEATCLLGLRLSVPRHHINSWDQAGGLEVPCIHFARAWHRGINMGCNQELAWWGLQGTATQGGSIASFARLLPLLPDWAVLFAEF